MQTKLESEVGRLKSDYDSAREEANALQLQLTDEVTILTILGNNARILSHLSYEITWEKVSSCDGKLMLIL